MCRSPRELSNDYLPTKLDFDTAENETCKVCPLSASLAIPQVWDGEAADITCQAIAKLDCEAPEDDGPRSWTE